MAVQVQVAIVADFLEEDWPSMNLVAEHLVRAQNELPRSHDGDTEVEAVAGFRCHLVRPPMRRRLSRQGQVSGSGYAFDRLVGRFHDYPRFLRRLRPQFDLFHLADHSYSQLVHELPPGRTMVTCHDLDTFRCLWAAKRGARSTLLAAMTRRILSGLQKAAHVFCDSRATRDELLDRRLLPADRVSIAYLGVGPALLEPLDTETQRSVEALLAAHGSRPDEVRLLHVGSTIARKRIDVLLDVFAELRKLEPRAVLYRAGGPFTGDQRAQAERVGIARHIRALGHMSHRELAVLYRRVDVVLQPSDAEGFGLPVAEALACGTPVLASDLPVLREVGGAAAVYARVGDVSGWVDRVRALLAERNAGPAAWAARREACRQRGIRFSWEEYARHAAGIYRHVLASAGGTSAPGPPRFAGTRA
jgi:glycosyltransferase involved in cell wall biosynthesis